MAITTTVVRTDDLDGTSSQDVRNVRFSIDDRFFEIDLTEEHADELNEVLARYTAHARRVGAPAAAAAARRGRFAAAAGASGHDPKAIRAWAQANGREVPARGRIPKVVVAEYEAAQAS